MLHILWECGVAQDVWASSNIGLQKQATSQVDMVQLLEDLLDRISGGNGVVSGLMLGYMEPTKCYTAWGKVAGPTTAE